MPAGVTVKQDTIMRQPRIFCLAGLLGAPVFAGSVFLLHPTRIAINLTGHYVSDFANGRLGRVFVLATAVHGFRNLGLGLGLRQSLAPGSLRAGAVLIFGLAAGIVVAALYPIDPDGRYPALVVLVHRVATIAAFPLELVAVFLFLAAFARHSRSRRRCVISFVLSTIAAIRLVGFLLAFVLNRMAGLTERLALASFRAWELWVSRQLAEFASDVEVAR